MRTRLATRTGGYSLIELMITVAIVAILARIATVSYLGYVQKATRADAKNALATASQMLERCYSQTFTYLNCPTPAAASPNGSYVIAFASSSLTASTYTLTATPAAGGAASSDAKCTSFSVDQTGAQSSTGTADSGYCWLGHN